MKANRRMRGFTLIELLVVLSIIALLTALVSPRYVNEQQRARETVLRTNLAALRDAIDQFSADRGKAPESLDDLVSQHYLRRVPEDPVTGRTDSWKTDNGDEGGIREVHSGAEGQALDGSSYANW